MGTLVCALLTSLTRRPPLRLVSTLDTQPSFGCDISTFIGNTYTKEWSFGGPVVSGILIQVDTWYTVRVEVNPDTAEFRYYLNDVLVGSQVPNDAATLKVATNLVPRVGTWNGMAGVTGARYIDDVRITAAQP
jgi:hypothetical protein